MTPHPFWRRINELPWQTRALGLVGCGVCIGLASYAFDGQVLAALLRSVCAVNVNNVALILGSHYHVCLKERWTGGHGSIAFGEVSSNSWRCRCGVHEVDSNEWSFTVAVRRRSYCLSCAPFWVQKQMCVRLMSSSPPVAFVYLKRFEEGNHRLPSGGQEELP